MNRLVFPGISSMIEGIEFYHLDGTSGQFHSGRKSDVDLEWLPSGRDATNALMLSLMLVAYDLLGLCDQWAVDENESPHPEAIVPLDKRGFQRLLRSVSKDLLYFVARLTRHANR